jgi:hypothetical protein
MGIFATPRDDHATLEVNIEITGGGTMERGIVNCKEI